MHEVLDKEQLDSALRYDVELVFEEIVSNIVHYGTVDGRELDVCIAVEARAKPTNRGGATQPRRPLSNVQASVAVAFVTSKHGMARFRRVGKSSGSRFALRGGSAIA